MNTNYYKEWIRGSVLAYARGWKKHATLNWAFGILRSAKEWGNLSKHEILAILDEIKKKLVSLPAITTQELERVEKLRKMLILFNY